MSRLPTAFALLLLLLAACSSGTTITHHPGPGGSGGSGSPSGDDDGGGGACLATGADCTATPNNCCSSICVEPLQAGEPALCAVTCTTGSECGSNCCATLTDGTSMVCEPRGFCDSTCVAPGDACTSDLDCCANEACVDTNGGTCASTCTSGSDCMSGCCAPISGSTLSVCSAASFCAN